VPSDGEKLTEELLNELMDSVTLEFIEKLPQRKVSLPQRLNELLIQKHLKKSDVIRRSKLNTTFAYQIFSGDRNASRNKILQLALAMGLNLKETQDLLRISGVNELYCKDRRDAIIIFGITKGMTLEQIDDTLYKFGELTICEE